MSAHTPGPWVVRYIAGGGYDTLSSAYRVLNGPDDRDRIVEVDTRDYDDCVDGDDYGVETSEQAEANAHLIAAAPEMYEFVKAILADRSAYPWHIAAANLIAKAEGRQS
jgi:hypothetical protein